jgi:hypothetical protein
MNEVLGRAKANDDAPILAFVAPAHTPEIPVLPDFSSV